jgi:large subunit ribosomal protein L28
MRYNFAANEGLFNLPPPTPDWSKEEESMWRCDICGKSGMNSYRVSHSNKHTKVWLRANIQKVRVRINGGVRRMKVCTSCLKKGKVVKAA